jgi:hypothetical protein
LVTKKPCRRRYSQSIPAASAVARATKPETSPSPFPLPVRCPYFETVPSLMARHRSAWRTGFSVSHGRIPVDLDDRTLPTGCTSRA